MTIDELSVSAAKGIEPDGMSLPERAAWYPLRDLYAKARRGEISTADAKKQKEAISDRFDRDNAYMKDSETARRYNADLWIRIEDAAVRYAKAETHTTEADEFYEAVYRMRPSRKHTGDLHLVEGKENNKPLE